MRIQLAQHRWHSAGVHGLFGIDGVGRILRGDSIRANDAAELLVEIVLRPEKRGGTKYGGCKTEQQAGSDAFSVTRGYDKLRFV